MFIILQKCLILIILIEPLSEDMTNKLRSGEVSKKYSKSRETIPEFKLWLFSSTKGATKAYCRACDSPLNLTAGKFDPHKHSTSKKKHGDNCSAIQKQRSVLQMPTTSKETTLTEKVNCSESHLAAFVAEHDVAFNVAEHLPNLIKTVCPDSEISNKINCSRAKTTAIVNNVIGKSSFEELISLLRSNKFSLIVDESTDKGCVKHLAVVARVVIDGTIKYSFLILNPVKRSFSCCTV